MPPKQVAANKLPSESKGAGSRLVALGSSPPREYSLDKTTIAIGTHPANDVVLDDTSVSRFHGWLQKDDGSGKWTVTDAGSKNGTWVASLKLSAKKPVILENGARLRVGNLELTFYTSVGFRALIQQRAIG